jgi:hypothetical protein
MLILSFMFFHVFCASNFINPRSVEKGMQGIALSTFEGNKIDTIQVEVLGVMSNYRFGKDIIIAKLKGKVVDETGVIAGMSGSPVYIEGKLLGAIAYGWSFSKEPICGITPFADMKGMSEKKAVGSSSFTPIKPILTIAGFPASSVSHLDSLPFDFTFREIVLGGETKDVTELVPGGVCGVTLVSGDGNVSAMGTITEVVGDTIFAFGHSAYATGASMLPFCGGSVLTCFPSLYKSFKLAMPGDIIGKVVFDGGAGLRAVIGDEPPMIDCRIKIGTLEKRYKVTAERSIFNVLPSFLVFSNWVEEMGEYEKVTVSGEINVWTEQGNILVPISISGEAIQRDLYQWVREPIISIEENIFEGVNIDSVSVNVSSEPGVREYFVKNLSVKKNKFEPGEMININVVLSRYRNKDTTITFKFEAPEDPCDLTLRVAGRNEYTGFELGRAPLKFEFDNFGEWKDFFNSLPPPDILIFSVYKKEASLITNVGEIKSPPPSLGMILEKREKNIFRDLYPIFEEKMKFDGPLSGESSSLVEVRR